ncbi:MAG: hypothetical protein U5L45_10645 [Saprospiraceae bacterium]|nr:hypothetical protein [Saprospiraceae bacterium]
MRERSARKTSVFNQKTMFLGYAHSSITLFKNILKPYIKSKLLVLALASLAREEMLFIFRAKPEK